MSENILNISTVNEITDNISFISTHSLVLIQNTHATNITVIGGRVATDDLLMPFTIRWLLQVLQANENTIKNLENAPKNPTHAIDWVTSKLKKI